MYIALQSDVGVGMSQQLAKGLYIAPRLQTGSSKGVAQCVRAHLTDSRLLQIRFDAFSIAAGFGGLGLAAGQEPCSLAGASAQLSTIRDSCFGMGISRREVGALGGGMDNL